MCSGFLPAEQWYKTPVVGKLLGGNGQNVHVNVPFFFPLVLQMCALPRSGVGAVPLSAMLAQIYQQLSFPGCSY